MIDFQNKQPMQRDDRVPAREITRRLQRLTVAIEQRAQQYTEELCHHLEAFVAKFMATYMKFVEETFGGF